jgi:hypothetical protein
MIPKLLTSFTNPISIQILHIPHLKGEMILKSAMKCQKNKFLRTNTSTRKMIVYHRHKKKVKVQNLYQKKLMVEVEEKKLMGKLNLSLTLIPSFCTFLIPSSHFSPTTIE